MYIFIILLFLTILLGTGMGIYAGFSILSIHNKRKQEDRTLDTYEMMQDHFKDSLRGYSAIPEAVETPRERRVRQRKEKRMERAEERESLALRHKEEKEEEAERKKREPLGFVKPKKKEDRKERTKREKPASEKAHESETGAAERPAAKDKEERAARKRRRLFRKDPCPLDRLEETTSFTTYMCDEEETDAVTTIKTNRASQEDKYKFTAGEKREDARGKAEPEEEEDGSLKTDADTEDLIEEIMAHADEPEDTEMPDDDEPEGNLETSPESEEEAFTAAPEPEEAVEDKKDDPVPGGEMKPAPADTAEGREHWRDRMNRLLAEASRRGEEAKEGEGGEAEDAQKPGEGEEGAEE